jgi:hypothetical protein
VVGFVDHARRIIAVDTNPIAIEAAAMTAEALCDGIRIEAVCNTSDVRPAHSADGTCAGRARMGCADATEVRGAGATDIGSAQPADMGSAHSTDMSAAAKFRLHERQQRLPERCKRALR